MSSDTSSSGASASTTPVFVSAPIGSMLPRTTNPAYRLPTTNTAPQHSPPWYQRRSQTAASALTSTITASPSLFNPYSHDSSPRLGTRPRTSTSVSGPGLVSSPRLGTVTMSATAPKAAAAVQPVFEETTTFSFTWTLRNLESLLDHGDSGTKTGKSDVWMTTPLFGNGNWKLELVQTVRPEEAHTDEGGEHTGILTHMSVYLSAVTLDYNRPDMEIPASVMVAYRPVSRPYGDFAWQRFYEHTFTTENGFFDCQDLPSISNMLEECGENAIALTIQLGVGPGHMRGTGVGVGPRSTVLQVDGHSMVPQSIINGLHGLLDDDNTGDVRIVVRERGLLLPSQGDKEPQIVPFPVGSSIAIANDHVDDPWHLDPDHVFVRTRYLWAHSSVLRHRSDYFATMLGSGFSEGLQSHTTGTADFARLAITDADFVTVYWFLRYLYTQQIKFTDRQDVRSAALDQDWTVGASPDASGWISISDLKALTEHDDTQRRMTASTSGALRTRTQSHSVPTSPTVHDHSTLAASTKHTHPTTEPMPASALLIFQLAHQYDMDDLSRLAAGQLVSSLTPHSAFALLLATSMYTDLHQSIKAYVYANWTHVAQSSEFERCCDQVSNGIWGPTAGKTLRTFMASLVSPE